MLFNKTRQYKIKKMFLPILSLLFIPRALGLSAYDCRGVSINKTTISLVETPTCTEHQPNVTTSSVNLAVTQTTTISEIEYYRCSVEAYHFVQRCGTFVDTLHRDGHYSEVYHITREECATMVNGGYINLRWGNNAKLSLSKSGTTTFSYISFGNVYDGKCKSGGTLVSPTGIQWDSAVRTTRLELTYVKNSARLFHDEGTIKFPSGVSCKVDDEKCDHAGYGQLFWIKPSPSCDSTNPDSSLIFKGIGSLITDNDVFHGQNPNLFIQVTQGHYDFQIKLTKLGVSVCGFQSYSTEHPRLFVTVLPVGAPDFPLRKEVGGEDVNLLNYINSKFIYSMRHTRQEVNRLFHIFEQERCKLQNRITDNMMTLALVSPKEFAYQYFSSPGYTAVVRGEVVHVAKCREVAVIPLKLENNCYNELPVNYNNETWFMLPRTRILVKVGSIVECASDLGPQYLLNGRWVTPTSVGLMAVKNPVVITPSPLSYEFEQLEDLASNGLYTSETILKYQKILTSPLEEKIITTRLADAISGKYPLPTGTSLSNAMEWRDFENIESKISSWSKAASESMKAIGGWFGFGMFVIFFMKLTVGLINSLVNFKFLKQTHGCLIALLFCLFDTITHFIIKGDLLKKKESKVEGIEEGQDESCLSNF